MSLVFVLDKNRKPLSPCHPAQARKILANNCGAVLRRYPMVLILNDKKIDNFSLFNQSFRLKIDPGADTTGLAIVNNRNGKVVWAANLKHRGFRISESLKDKASHRRHRRSRFTRYRKPRFLNRAVPKGWLPPSLESRLDNILTWVNRIMKYCPIDSISMELVRFDTQKMQNPEISGVEYQQGELHGYEVREYLLEKWNRKCAYCNKKDIPLQIEHIIPRSKGGSNRISNLTLACQRCNQTKGTKTATEFGFPDIQKKAKIPLAATAAVNATRSALYNRLKNTGLPIECGSGGLTKYNRTKLGLPKDHWIDAACVGKSTPANLDCSNIKPLYIKAMGHGNRNKMQCDKYGFPAKDGKGNVIRLEREKYCQGLQTGDIINKVDKKGKYIATGRLVIKNKKKKLGRMKINGKEQDFALKYAKPVHRTDGYEYTTSDTKKTKK